eukprot:1156193-Pleurochrysis_carterae.AAC.1
MRLLLDSCIFVGVYPTLLTVVLCSGYIDKDLGEHALKNASKREGRRIRRLLLTLPCKRVRFKSTKQPMRAWVRFACLQAT